MKYFIQYILLFFPLSLLASCHNNDKLVFDTKEELCNWIKTNVTKYIQDSTFAKSVTINDWIYIAASNIDSIPNYYLSNNLFSPNQFVEHIIEVGEYEKYEYNTLNNELYLAGGFYHKPYKVYDYPIIKMNNRERTPISILAKDCYANYWQLAGEYLIYFRTYFALWYFITGEIPNNSSYIAICKYQCTNSPIINQGSSIFFLNYNGEVVKMIPLMDYDKIMQFINQNYWWTIANAQSPENRQKNIDSVLPLGNGHFVDRLGIEYNNDIEIIYGKEFGSWK